jgi:hypothetical protein
LAPESIGDVGKILGCIEGGTFETGRSFAT